MMIEKYTREQLLSAERSTRTAMQELKELKDRLDYQYKQIDGTYHIPSVDNKNFIISIALATCLKFEIDDISP